MTAAEVLVQAGAAALPVDLSAVAAAHDIKIVSYESCADYLGMSVQQLYEEALAADVTGGMLSDLARRSQLATTMKYSLVFIASLPMLIVYPFVQKYFVKGVMIGAIKG